MQDQSSSKINQSNSLRVAVTREDSTENTDSATSSALNLCKHSIS
jgi:hypothetical protein